MTLDFVSFAKKYAVVGAVATVILLFGLKKLGVFEKIMGIVKPGSKKTEGDGAGASAAAAGAAAGAAAAAGASAAAAGAGGDGAAAGAVGADTGAAAAAGDGGAAEGAPFIPSETFAGEKKGYSFKKGDSGTGYYLDKQKHS